MGGLSSKSSFSAQPALGQLSGSRWDATRLMLVRDKLSRLGSCCITEMVCVARTSEKVISTEWVDGGNYPRAEIKPGSMAVRPIELSFRTFKKRGIWFAKLMGTSGSMKQKDKSRTNLAGLPSGSGKDLFHIVISFAVKKTPLKKR